MTRRSPRRRRFFLCLVACGILVAAARNPETGERARRKLVALGVPFVKAGSCVARSARNVVGGFQGRRNLVAENAELTLKARVLPQVENALEEARLENERLRVLLALGKTRQEKAIPADVIGKSTAGGLSVLTINAGERRGVLKDMAVVSPAGVVGRVWCPSSNAALVQLLTDRNSGAAALIQRSRVQGIVTGLNDTEGLLKYIPKVEDVLPGDKVVTSGLDGIYPEGWEIGVVEKVEDPPDNFKRVTIKFSAPFNRLEEVLVVDARRGALPEPPERFEVAQKR